MKTILVPRLTRVVPNTESRAFHMKRNELYTVDKFQSYNDWFYFIHVDPFIRWIHAFGMVIGLFFYLIAATSAYLIGINWTSAIHVLTGVFFFYFLPLISHYIYDGGSAKSTPDKFHSTLIPVIHINIMTLTGSYDPWLRRFIQKYPFTLEAWDLEEKNVRRF